LAHKAESLGYYPEVILSGRRVNDTMGLFVANKVVKLMNKKGIPVRKAKALILGITFKENCPDIRNSKVPDIYEELKSFGMEVDVYDPHAHPQEVKQEYAIDLASSMSTYDAIILAVSHKEFLELDVTSLKKESASVIYDIKAILDPKIVDSRL
jgi:UDP-N-acetyl-D-galactosamine dehydrogenase